MAEYKYTARNLLTNKITKSTSEAVSERALYNSLKSQGYLLIEAKSKEGKSLFESDKVKSKDRVLFARQLSTLINAGLPLVQALNSVNEQTDSKPLKKILSRIIKNVEGGKALSKSLEEFPKVFNNIFINMVAAGEASGTLDKSLDRLATQQEKDAAIVKKIRGAMTYPILVIVVMIAVMTFMIVSVVPQIKVLYTSIAGASLPVETRVLLSIEGFVVNFWWLVILALLALGIFLYNWIKTKSGKKILDKAKLKIPILGPLFQKLYMARFSRTSSTLVGAGVPLLQVLQITAESVNNYYVSNSILEAAKKVKTGKSLGDTLKGDPYFLPLVPSVIKIGEQSGTIQAMLEKSAVYYEGIVDDTINNVSALIEPVMMILLGIVAIIIVLAVLLPIYSLAGSSALQG